MKYFSADYIYPISSSPVKNGLLVLQDNNTVLNFFSDKLEASQSLQISIDDSQIQKFEGIICPGFVNAHCHLELSHLKGQITRGTGLTGFIKELLSKRGQFTPEQIADCIEKAGEEMKTNGIVAVGDISNSNVSFAYKKISDIYFHTFIELFDLVSERAFSVFEEGKSSGGKLKSIENGNHHYSLVPHAPYTVSEKLFQLIASLADNQPVSIHNQETTSENELFLSHSGDLFDFFKSTGNALMHIPCSGKTSLQSYIPWMNSRSRTLFVHNTYTGLEDVLSANNYFNEAWWCLCPKANLFIENVLPDVKLLSENTSNMVLGTDSYASNTALSILEEIKVIGLHFKTLRQTELMKWATLNGAVFLGIEKKYGTLESGKKPGINLITQVDAAGILTEKSQVIRLA